MIAAFKWSLIVILTFLSMMSNIGSLSAQNSGINNFWLSGYSSWGGVPYGQTKINFLSGSPVINYDSLEMDFRFTHANISDIAGNLLFYTNGVYIADATNDTMINGSGINPGAYVNDFQDGLMIPQGTLIIKKPASDSIYYLFHSTIDNYPTGFGSVAYYLRLTEIDMSLNAGLGTVTNKNQILITDTLNGGKISACKHANGRDWWVMVHRVNSNLYYKLLVTPTGIFGPYTQNIGSIREWDAGHAKFSPDGKKFAYFHYRFTGLDVFDFDRCTGVLSNWINDATIPLVVGNLGCEFSPNSQLLYVCNITNIYQYDLSATNVIASRTMVAAWDSFTQPGQPNLGAYLCYPQLAPDGKIYITTGNSTTYMGRIDDPDVVGVGCNVAQHSVLLPTYYFNTIPNHPNYFLGCDTTSSCSCLTTNSQELTNFLLVKSYPNPTIGPLTLQFPVQNEKGWLEIYNVNGSLIVQETIAPWSQFKRLDLSYLNKGIYFCKVSWHKSHGQLKIIVE